jgi:endonuclease III
MTVEQLEELVALMLSAQTEHGKTLEMMSQYMTASAAAISALKEKLVFLEQHIMELEKKKTVKEFFN